MNLLKNSWYEQPDETPHFYGTDYKELFTHNLKKQPTDWRWRTRPVHYTLNSQGYRCEEFDKIDWSQSVLMFGCSFVFGVGVDDSETMPALISKKIGRPVINLGAGGTDDLFQFVNSNIIYSSGIRPKAVIYLWPGIYRLTEFTEGLNTHNYGVWNYQFSPMVENWITNHNQVRKFLHFLSLSVNNIWDCPILEYYPYLTSNGSDRYIGNYSTKQNLVTDEKLDPGLWPTIRPWGPVIDNARDISYTGIAHPGPDTYNQWVEKFVLPDLEKLDI